METIDTAVAINAPNGNLSPAENAVVAYQRHRNENPLPDNWADVVETVGGWKRFNVWYVPGPEGTDDITLVFVRYLQNENYVLELVFRDYPVKDAVTGSQGLVGGFQVELFRTDGATPTVEEAGSLARCLFGPDFGVLVGTTHYRELDGSLTHRPFPTVETELSATESQTHLGISFDMVVKSGGAETANGLATSPHLFPVATPRVMKRNTQADVRATVFSSIEHNLEKLRAVRTWVKCQIRLRREDLSLSSRNQYRADAKFTEIKYGLRHVKSWAGLYRDRRGRSDLGREEELKLAEVHVRGGSPRLRRSGASW